MSATKELTVREAAAQVGVHRRSIVYAIEAGKIKARKDKNLGHYLIVPSALAGYVPTKGAGNKPVRKARKAAAAGKIKARSAKKRAMNKPKAKTRSRKPSGK
jgi:excisionase family DNA binding protein